MSFKKKLLQGLSYSVVGVLVGNGLRFISSIFLTRLLAPDLFGVMLLANTFVYAAAMLSDVGLRSAIIQNSRADEVKYRDAVWTLIFLRGWVIAVFLLMLALLLAGLQRFDQPFLEGVYSDHRMVDALILLALSEVLGGAGSIHILLRERQLDFKSLFYLNVLKQAFGVVVTVIWATLDPGVVALCSGAIATNLFSMIYSHAVLGRSWPKFYWSPLEFVYIIRMGRWLLFGAVVVFLTNTVDRLYMGANLNSESLGVYSIALTIGLLGQEILQRAGNTVIFPALAGRLRDGAGNMSSDFYRIRRPFEVASIIIGLLMIVAGPAFVELIYDVRYATAGHLLQLLGVASLLLAYDLASDAYLAMGKNFHHAVVSIARLLVLVVSLPYLVKTYQAAGGALAIIVSRVISAMVIAFLSHRIKLYQWRAELPYFLVVVLSLAVGSLFFDVT
ncbi:MAG: oligosaccharide flippase family protein [Rubrivivax sp.]|jgi:O-antigen/teichoic acid export membrane protein